MSQSTSQAERMRFSDLYDLRVCVVDEEVLGTRAKRGGSGEARMRARVGLVFLFLAN